MTLKILLDGGSQNSYLRMKARKRLEASHLRVGTFGNQEMILEKHDLVQVKLHTKGGAHPVGVSACVVPEICSVSRQIFLIDADYYLAFVERKRDTQGNNWACCATK